MTTKFYKVNYTLKLEDGTEKHYHIESENIFEGLGAIKQEAEELGATIWRDWQVIETHKGEMYRSGCFFCPR